MHTNTLIHTSVATAAALAAVTVVLSSSPHTDDDLINQPEDNRNSHSVITLPAAGPVTVDFVIVAAGPNSLTGVINSGFEWREPVQAAV